MMWMVLASAGIMVAFFVVALSLTQIFKGRDIRGEMGSNPDMQRLGLTCPAREDGPERCDDGACADCTVKAVCKK